LSLVVEVAEYLQGSADAPPVFEQLSESILRGKRPLAILRHESFEELAHIVPGAKGGVKLSNNFLFDGLLVPELSV
jgi:hypothetical protein